jgi:hypothetical protein
VLPLVTTGIGRDSSDNIFAVNGENRRVVVSTSAAPALNLQ